MIHQSDISDILGRLADSPVVGTAYKRQVKELFRYYALGGGVARNGSRRQTPESFRVCRQAVCPRVQVGFPRLHSQGDAAKEGGRMSGFVANIEARIAIINKMIASAKTAERRALQKERADLEAKLRKVSV